MVRLDRLFGRCLSTHSEDELDIARTDIYDDDRVKSKLKLLIICQSKFKKIPVQFQVILSGIYVSISVYVSNLLVTVTAFPSYLVVVRGIVNIIVRIQSKNGKFHLKL